MATFASGMETSQEEAAPPMEQSSQMGASTSVDLAAVPQERERSRSPRSRGGYSSGENDAASVALAPRVQTYAEIDPEKWVAKQVGKSSMGSPTICIYDNATRTSPIFCLYKDDECGTLVFPLEPRKDAEKPAFMTGAEPTKKVESLDLITTLEGDQLAMMRTIDEWAKKQAMDNARDWFGRNCSATEIDVMYSSPIKVDEQGKYAPHLRAKMNLSGIDKFLTHVTFVRSNGVPEEGSGWEFVEQRLGEQKWRQHRSRMVLEARRIWIVGKKFGLTYSITDLAVREKAERRATPFANDSTVDRLASLASC